MPSRRRSPLRPPSKPTVKPGSARPDASRQGQTAGASSAGQGPRAPQAAGKGEGHFKHGRTGPEAAVKLHKALADAGLGSRRDMEAWIVEGRVTVNNQTARVGDRVTSLDVIKVSGRRVYLRPATEKRIRVLLYHKQEGEIVSRDDPQGRATVFEQLPRIRGAKWVSVGRLDYNTEGLMLFTTSGELANRLMHPRFEVEREYAVRVLGELTPAMQQQLIHGVELEDGEARVERLEEAGGEGANRWWRVVIKEGRYREVRRLFAAVGVKVSRLIRTRYGPIALPPQLKRGQKQELDDMQVRELLKWAGIASRPAPARPRQAVGTTPPRRHAGARKTRR